MLCVTSGQLEPGESPPSAGMVADGCSHAGCMKSLPLPSGNRLGVAPEEVIEVKMVQGEVLDQRGPSV